MPYHPQLFDFAYFPGYDNAIEYLADTLAAPEEWDFSDARNKNNTILKTYLEFTYRRLKEENKVAFTSNNSHACFNTGVVTNNLEDIFAFFEKHRNPPQGSSQQFCFKAFIKESDGQLLKYFSSNIPDVANYFHKPEDLIFNPRLRLIPNIDHIITDNADRFPDHLKGAAEDELRRQIVGSIDETKRKVRTNYKIAVPQYNNGRIQLLLPLCLTAGSPNPDLALLVHKVDDSTYTARTCLTLKMAYQNARLIVKPQSNWLKP